MDRRQILGFTAAAAFLSATVPSGGATFMLIDDLSRQAPLAANGASWEFVADRVMGGVSTGSMSRETVEGRTAIRLRGAVSLDNNGGFIQAALDLSQDGKSLDASAWRGIAFDVFGNGEEYNLHLRTEDVRRPWQSYRQTFTARKTWQTILLPFEDFRPYRIDAPLDLTKLRRIGFVAIGRVFAADVAIGGVRLYR